MKFIEFIEILRNLSIIIYQQNQVFKFFDSSL